MSITADAAPPDLQTTYAAFQGRFPARHLTIGGVSWRLIDTQVGEKTVLLLPGALGRGETAFEYILALAACYRVLSPDYPGGLHRMTALCDAIAALLDALETPFLPIVGGSFGGLVAQAFADRYPASVRGLVLTDTTAPTRTRLAYLTAAWTSLRSLPEPIVRTVIGRGIGNYLSGIPLPARTFWADHFAESLARLTRDDLVARARIWIDFDRQFATTENCAGVLIVTAADDRMITSAARRTLQRRYPRATTHLVHGGGHAASLTSADEYIAAIVSFIEANQ